MLLRDESSEASRDGIGTAAEVWKLGNALLLAREAIFRDRADMALGLLRRTDERAQLHQRLVEGRNVIRRRD